ncbi:MAG: phosphoenolpyruvate--protein phosphotransferase [Deltaproteobacteria bacterium]|nr:MAG: phosphoenolpyruvate--protein phosphotransferase [Deltaproteobacteria bacterium]
MGAAYVVQREGLIVPEYEIRGAQVDFEIERLRASIEVSVAQIERIERGVRHVEMVGAILQTQVAILRDQMLLDDVSRRIREERKNAEWAVRDELRHLERLFAAMEDPYIRERRADLDFIARRLLSNLLGRAPRRFDEIAAPAVVVAHDLSPAETAQLDRDRVVGIVTETGARTSHAAIMANSLGIPAVVGVASIVASVRDGDAVVVEGSTGRVHLRPDEATRRMASARAHRYARREREMLRAADLPCETRDGHRIEILGNIERSDEVPRLRERGGRGVGLFRTEFLYLNRSAPPDEAEQLRHYRAVLRAARPDPVVIRTLDLGGDKLASWLHVRDEMNPALGMRGIRRSLADRSLFRTQLRALLRASPDGRLRILLPLVTGVSEVREARACLDEVRSELELEGRPYAPDLEIGVMVETPAAVTLSDILVREVDFLSVGTNDLIQYTIAVDRSNEHVAYLYTALHPAVLRAIWKVVDSAHRAGAAVCVCGEMAGDPINSLVLLGLGVDELSMNPHAIPAVKQILRASNFESARALAAELRQLPTVADVTDRVHKVMQQRFPEAFAARAGSQGPGPADLC